MKRKDVNQIAHATLMQAIGEWPKELPQRKAEAAKLGSRGGKKGGAARARVLTPEQKKEIASKAAKARWAKKA